MTGMAGAHLAGHRRRIGPSHRLLWFAGGAALCLSAAAFVLWGLDGAGILVDLIAAFCA